MTLLPGAPAAAQRSSCPSAPAAGSPAPRPIADACRAAGASLARGPEATPAGILVRFTSPDHAGRALRALHALGYQATRGPGIAVTVSGWNRALLAARAVRLQVTLSEGDRDPADWAGPAVARFRELRAGGQADEPAVALVVDEARVTALEPCLSQHHVPAPVDGDDRRRARGQVRDLLDEVCEGQAAAAALAGYAQRIAETAVRLFLAERDLRGQNESVAGETAIRKAAGLCGPVPGGLSIQDPVTRKARVLAQPCTTCVTRKGNPFGTAAERVIRRNVEADALLICHATLPWGPHPEIAPAACAGFWARHARDVAVGRLALRLGIIRVPAPSPAAGQNPDLSPGA